MPYDVELEKKIDRQAAAMGVDEKKRMFGGIGYMIKGNMPFGVHKSWLIVRTTPEKAEEWLKKEVVRVFDITGRPMKGWLMIDPATIKTDQQLTELLKMGRDFVKTLPEK